MSCNLYTLTGMPVQCKDSIGGIKKVWFALSEDVDSSNVTASAHTIIPAAKASGQTVSTIFKAYNFRKATGSMTSTLNSSDTAGNSFSTEVTLQFLKQEASKHLEVMGLLMNEMVGIVKDGNGKYWFIGKDYPVSGSAGTAETGTAMTDLNGYNITIKDDSLELPYEITDATTITALESI